MSNSNGRTTPVKLQLPVAAQTKEREDRQRTGHKFWRLGRHKRKPASVASSEYLQPLDPIDQDSSSNELDDTDSKEYDQDENKLGAYERDEEEDSLVSL